MDAKFVQPRRAVPGSIERHPSMPPSGMRAVPVELHCCDRAVIATMRRTRAMVGPIQADQWPFIQPDLHRSRSVGSARTFDGLTPAAPGVHWGSR